MLNGPSLSTALGEHRDDVDKVLAAAKFNQGFATTEYLGAAMLDQRWHQIGADHCHGGDRTLDLGPRPALGYPCAAHRRAHPIIST